MSLLLLVSVILSGGAVSAFAEDASPAWQVEEKLTTTEQEITASQRKQRQLDRKARSLEKELKPLQQEMVELAQSMRQTEGELSTLEEKLTILEQDKQEKQQRLQQHRQQLAASLQAMLRLSRIPPEAVTAMPGELEDTLRTARLLGMLTDGLQREAGALTIQLAALQDVEHIIATHHRELSEHMDELETRRQAMDRHYKTRKTLQKNLLADADHTRQELKKLSRRSGTLKELVQTLEKKREESLPPHAIPHSKPVRTHKQLRSEKHASSFIAQKGKIRLPVTGKISSFFGDAKGKNEKHLGITITARSFAQVVAPSDGEVVFTGPFLDYGSMVIVRHSSAYHTLLAGMQTVDCAPGQNLLAGEPLGTMGGNGKRKLYVELRKHSKPVDPAAWFTKSGG